MNELTQKIQRILTPKAALIAYRCDECRTNSTEYFLELRPIHKNGQMGAGMPVTYEFMNALMESYTEEMSGIPAGVLPETCWPAIREKDRRNTSGATRRAKDRCSSTSS